MTEPCKYYSVKDIQSIMGCGRDKAYQLVKSSSFPSTRIGKIMFIDKEEFEKWRKRNSYTEVFIK